jgi:2,5-dichloro-2,5-cyclohexadiene-1,4-diol dehydrogenase 1
VPEINGSSLLVTGGASGIGRAIVLQAAAAGARVTLADRSDDAARLLVDEIVGSGGTAQYIRTDISLEADVQAMVQAAVAAYGCLDFAINNAAVAGHALLLHEIEEAQFRKVLDVNTVGTFFCLKHELRAMLSTGGAIVNIGAAAGATAVPNLGEYMASKSAVTALTKSAALDYAKYGIRVNTVLPGVTRTPMAEQSIAATPGLEEYLIQQQPIARLGQPEEIATAALWLLSDAASFITGAALPVDGGYLL